MRKLLPILFALGAGQAVAMDRTVSWYAANDQARTRMLRLCENDPGNLRYSPDCINARQGEIKAVADRIERERRAPASRAPQKSPAWFNARPQVRQTILAHCRQMNARQRAQFGQCENAERALMLAARR